MKKQSTVPQEITSQEELATAIIAKIDSILEEKNLTRRQLAKMIERDEGVLSRMLSGKQNLTLDTIAMLSNALGEPLIKIAD